MKKKPILLKKMSKGRNEVHKTTIGLVGTHRGVGVTHVGILLANSLRKSRGIAIAYIEMGEKSHVKYLAEKCQSNTCIQGKDKSLQICKVSYYMSVNDTKLISILNEPYDCFILDFGSELKNNKNEFLRCHIKLVVGNLIEWKRIELENFVVRNREIAGFHDWLYFIVFGRKEDMAEVQKQLDIRLNSVGFEPELFCPSKEFINLCEKIIC